MKNIINFTEAFKIGLHAMWKLAASGQKISTKHLADEIDASEYHLSKVMQRLSRSGLVSSINGPNGGFFLSKKPEKIKIMDIYEAIEGNFEVTKCMYPQKICNKKTCPIENLITQTGDFVKKYFSGTFLSEIIK